ncbi:MarR family transcriptional regulator [Candidatus Pelagibacter sp. Uisw_113]|uniref:MarR family transcriptional regulator n=1 Tax=Candidatus Pelagibacter sp. Uisw_113 TaxID=3230994 RepID=UPI0039EB31BA
MSILEDHSKTICASLLHDLIEVNKGNTSIKFFRKDLTTMIIWLFIMHSYANKEKINIEDIARELASNTRISKPSLRLILENAKEKGFLKFTLNENDNRSWIIEPEIITIEEFNAWCKRIGSLEIS